MQRSLDASTDFHPFAKRNLSRGATKTKFVTGIVLGLVLGSAVSAFALGGRVGWSNGMKLMENSRDFRSGYLAGASDMLTVVVSYNKISNSSFSYDRNVYPKAERCLAARSKGPLSQFVRWAERFLLGSDVQAAELLLYHACD